MTTQTRFDCTCKGCRGRTADLDSVWQWQQIPDKIQGHYFDDSTRRFFSSRINSWRHLSGGALAVRESMAGDMDNTYRIHKVVVFCKYGAFVSESEKFKTGKKAQEHMTNMADTVEGCDCHGCTLDREGRG